MTLDDLRQQIQQVDGSGYGHWATDVALKFYFFPLSSALFEEEELDEFMEDDLLRIRPEHQGWVEEQMGLRMGQLVREMALPETYLSVVVYGVMAGGEDRTLVYDLDETGGVSIATLSPRRELAPRTESLQQA